MVNFLIQSVQVLDFKTVLWHWRIAGVFDIILPFLLIFALIFAILERTKVLGQNKAIYAIVSLAISFFAISDPTITGFFAYLFSNAALGFAVLLVFILFLGMFTKGEGLGGWVWVGSLFAILVFIWVIGRSIINAGFNTYVFGFFQTNTLLWSSIVWGLALLAVIVLVVISSSSRPNENIAETFRKAFGGGGHH